MIPLLSGKPVILATVPPKGEFGPGLKGHQVRLPSPDLDPGRGPPCYSPKSPQADCRLTSTQCRDLDSRLVELASRLLSSLLGWPREVSAGAPPGSSSIRGAPLRRFSRVLSPGNPLNVSAEPGATGICQEALNGRGSNYGIENALARSQRRIGMPKHAYIRRLTRTGSPPATMTGPK